MEVEKRGSKGGFLQLFDWNVKSRKKLFSNKTELSEGSKQGEENFDCEAVKINGDGPGPSVKGSNRDYNCALSAIGDEGDGTRAPSVVAKLMGLHSLPISHSPQPSCTSFLDSHSFKGIHSQRTTTGFQSEHHDIAYSSMQDKQEGFVTNVDMRMQKVQSRPIQRFQTEILPPKSAKSIPITRHRLLSPIKSPGFVTTQNATYIMEAASKIIEHGPQSTTNSKGTSSRPSSVPLRIHNLKEEIEAAQKASWLPDTSQRPRDSSSVNHMKGQPNDGKQNGSLRTQFYKASADLEKGSSDHLRHKRKSVSLAVQAKVNIQTQEGLTSSVNRNFMNHKVDNEVKQGHFDKRQQNAQRRTLTSRRSDVLRQNGQKQNCESRKEKVSLKLSNQEDRKSAFMNLSCRTTRASNKVAVDSVTRTRKTKSVATDCGKEHSSCKAKISFKKKQPVSGHTHCEESGVDNVLIEKNGRSIKCNVAVDGCSNWDAVERKNSMDIVSFTFTSPIKKSVPASQLPGVLERSDSSHVNFHHDQSDFENSALSRLGLPTTGGDALNALLEQKLQELACMVDSSHSINPGVAFFAASNLQESGSTPNFVNSMLADYEKGFQLDLQNDKPDGLLSSDCSLADGLLLKAKRNWEGSKVIEEHCSTSNQSEYRNKLACQCPSPVASLEPSFSDGSFYSSDSKTSLSSYGSKHFLLSEAQGTFNGISAKMPLSMDGETELSDSASSVHTGCTDRKDTATIFSFVDLRRPSNSDLDYVGDILCNAELVLEDFAACQAQGVINPNLFDQLENQKVGSYKNKEENSKIGRKVLFDCVSECLQLRSERLLIGGCKALARWEMLSLEKEQLAEELYKEIAGWTSMEDLMVDELVDKDMSTKYGKWVEFDIEAFEEGVELEEEVLSSLIDEFVSDLLF